MNSSATAKPVNWKVNLAALWVAQFFSLSAFNFCLPFLPLYLKASGIATDENVTFYAGLFAAAGPVSMMVMSPIWGTLGDRYGRKMMLVRATLSGAFVLYLMGVVHNIEALIVLRMLQGAFTGTIPSAQTLVVTGTPDRNQGFAIGVLMAAVNAGTMAGQYFGGVCAKYLGVEWTFKIAGLMLVISTVMVVALVRENFIRPEPLPAPNTTSARLRRRRETITNFKAGIPVLLTVAYIALVQTFDAPYLSLYVDWLFRASPEAAGMDPATTTSHVYGIVGTIGGLASLSAMFGSILVGAIMDKDLPDWIWAVVAAAAAVGLACSAQLGSVWGLAAGRSIFMFFINGLASVIVVVQSRMTPSSKRGAALGWSTTARCIGWAVAPVSGAYFAHTYGFTAAYAILAGICAMLAPIFVYLDRRFRLAFHPLDDDPPSIDMVGKNSMTQPGGQGRIG